MHTFNILLFELILGKKNNKNITGPVDGYRTIDMVDKIVKIERKPPNNEKMEKFKKRRL